ncbi:hypothetical protein HYE13_00870 [Mycoplasmopsis bovis]|nr:hypothetical protein [Mycoplasmopsis bovis]QQH25959.1 hypothetical protein HYE13_00870 [Mycoplasmopsis bovis]
MARKSKIRVIYNHASGTSLEDWTFLLSADEAKIKELEGKAIRQISFITERKKFGENILEKEAKNQSNATF